jgi:hypothetical protein
MNNNFQGMGRTKLINGFPRVADKLASDPDKTSTIFRRFDRLSCRNLLYLEAELAELELLQDKSDEEDLKSPHPTTIKCHGDRREFERCAKESDRNGQLVYPKQAERFALAMKMKIKLKEYRQCI